MQNRNHMTRLGGTAIAAALALTATPAFAQEATPQISVPQETPAPVTQEATPTPAPAPEPATDPLAAAPAPEPAATTAVPVGKKATTTKTTKPAARTTARPAATPRAAAPVATSTAAPAAAAPLPTDPAALPPAETLAPPPVAAVPVEPTPVAEAPAAVSDDTLPIALGAGGLGILALGGAAFAMRRRRRHAEEEQDYLLEEETVAEEPTFVREEPVVTTPVHDTIPAMAAAPAEKSAFNWTQTGTAAAAAGAGRNWIERAYDGPSPENPFLSLKKRLRRAAFYDQRERAVAAGKAAPLSPMAGLPSKLAEAIKPKAKPATANTFGYGFSYAPA